MNYKNLTFSNTLEGFKSWSKEFPPLDEDAVKAQGFKKHEDYYLECQLVCGFLGAGKFVATVIREYNHKDRDFESVSVEKEKELESTVFRTKIESFKNKHLYS